MSQAAWQPGPRVIPPKWQGQSFPCSPPHRILCLQQMWGCPHPIHGPGALNCVTGKIKTPTCENSPHSWSMPEADYVQGWLAQPGALPTGLLGTTSESGQGACDSWTKSLLGRQALKPRASCLTMQRSGFCLTCLWPAWLRAQSRRAGTHSPG